jgi:hypothetical protein
MVIETDRHRPGGTGNPDRTIIMSNLQQIQTAVAAVSGIELRKPLPAYELDAIAAFQADDSGMSAAVEQFVELQSRVALIGQQVQRGAHLPPVVGHDVTYLVGDLRVRITVTGGTYSAPLLGITAARV